MGWSDVARFSTDTETTFGTTAAGGLRDQRLAIETVKHGFKRIRHPDRTVVNRLHDLAGNHKLGSQFGSTVDGTFYLDGLAAADVLNAAASYAFPQNNIGEILRASLGGQVGGAGSTVQAGSTTAVINVGVGHGVRFTEGAAFGCYTTAGFEVRRIVDVTADAVTPH